MRLLLVRHAETPSNVDHLLDTAVPGPGLTALGARQATALPDALAAEDIGALYASTLVRAQLTAAPLAAARGLDVRVRDGIREIAAGDLEMLPGDSEQGALYMKTAFAWAAGDTALRMPGGESGDEVLALPHLSPSLEAGGPPSTRWSPRRRGPAPARSPWSATVP